MHIWWNSLAIKYLVFQPVMLNSCILRSSSILPLLWEWISLRYSTSTPITPMYRVSLRQTCPLSSITSINFDPTNIFGNEWLRKINFFLYVNVFLICSYLQRSLSKEMNATASCLGLHMSDDGTINITKTGFAPFNSSLVNTFFY